MAHATMEKFGYPDTNIGAYEYWSVQLRPKQATLGALVLICKEDATAFSAISPTAFAEMPKVLKDIETTLSRVFSYDKINYLMLMMVDPHVHCHVLPRYKSPKAFEGQSFTDPAWPGPPDIAHVNETQKAVFDKLLQELRQAWPSKP